MKMSRMLTFNVVLCAAAFAAAQTRPIFEPETSTTQPTPDVVVRFYEVGDLIDLFRAQPAYSLDALPTGKPRPFETGPGAAGPAPDDFFLGEETLKAVLADTVEPDSWKVNGGTSGLIADYHGSATWAITQTAAGHAAVAQRLNALRDSRLMRTMLATRATWLLLDAGQIRAIEENARRAAPAGATMGPAIVDDATYGLAIVYAAATTTGHDRQTVSIVSRSDRASSTLQATPQLSGDDAAVVDLHADVIETRSAEGAAATRPVGYTQSLATTVRLPLGKRVLVAGATQSVGVQREAFQLCLVVQVDAVR